VHSLPTFRERERERERDSQASYVGLKKGRKGKYISERREQDGKDRGEEEGQRCDVMVTGKCCLKG